MKIILSKLKIHSLCINIILLILNYHSGSGSILAIKLFLTYFTPRKKVNQYLHCPSGNPGVFSALSLDGSLGCVVALLPPFAKRFYSAFPWMPMRWYDLL